MRVIGLRRRTSRLILRLRTLITTKVHDICFFGENSEYFVSTGASGGAVRVYSWYAKKGATLTFSNPTLTLTRSKRDDKFGQIIQGRRSFPYVRD